jgi:RNA polymerase sigma-70 factor (ECF subfamily)
MIGGTLDLGFGARIAGHSDMEQRADRDLIADGRRGDDAAISELFRRHYAASMRLARGILRSEDECQDVVQAAFLSAFRHLEGFRGDSTFKTWLSRIVVNQCYMHMREPWRRLSYVDLDSPYGNGAADKLKSSMPTPEKLTFGAEIRAAVDDGAARLPGPLREVFTLYSGSGLSLADVATMLGLTLPAVKTRLFRANLRMRSHLQPLFSNR